MGTEISAQGLTPRAWIHCFKRGASLALHERYGALFSGSRESDVGSLGNLDFLVPEITPREFADESDPGYLALDVWDQP